MSAVPTRIRQNIRDHITSPTCPLVLKTNTVITTLGYPIILDPEWTMLWKTLQEHYPEQSTFVPFVAATIVTWCDAFMAWLENDENEEVVERLLDALKARSGLYLILEVSPTSNRPTTSWRASKADFVIALPKATPVPQNTVLAGFTTDFINLFTASPIMSSLDAPPRSLPILDDKEDWADLDIESPHAAQSSKHPKLRIFEQQDEIIDVIPEISTLPRPEELTKRPPYWLSVKQESLTRIMVHGSHTPSLVCLEGYLKRWCRGEASRANRPPVVEIKLQESAFGLGLMNDTLTLEAIRGREVSAMLVLVFVENVLGYELLDSARCKEGVWEFRRLKGFR